MITARGLSTGARWDRQEAVARKKRANGSVRDLEKTLVGNLRFLQRVNQSKKVVDDGNLTYFIIRYR
jgi:hypothetical protein